MMAAFDRDSRSSRPRERERLERIKSGETFNARAKSAPSVGYSEGETIAPFSRTVPPAVRVSFRRQLV